MIMLNLVLDIALMRMGRFILTFRFSLYLIQMSALLSVNVLKILKASNPEDFLMTL